MSFDIFVQDLPAEAKSIADIPDSFVPRPLDPRARIARAISRILPNAVFDRAGWATVDGPDFSVEINLGTADPVENFSFHLRGGKTGLSIVAEILNELGYRALAPGTASGFFEPLSDTKEAYDRWRRWLAQGGQGTGDGGREI